VMTDRTDLDSQIYRTFVGCGIADEETPRASSGDVLKDLLQGNHRFVFSLIHKFNKDVDPREPYSTRDDIIVISDEAHRTQAGAAASMLRLRKKKSRQRRHPRRENRREDERWRSRRSSP
jgi:type I restriction enzyme, R subunit